MTSTGTSNPKMTSLSHLAASFHDVPLHPKSTTTYTQRPSRLSKTQTTVRSIAVSSSDDLPKTRILPTARNITIFSTLGTACVILCIILVLLKHVSIWVTLAACFCGVLGAALYLEVALLVSARYRSKILDEECAVEDMIDASKERRRRGLSWDLRGIGKKKDGDDQDEKLGGITEHRHSVASHMSRSIAPSIMSVTEDDEYDEKDVAIEVAIQKPIPAATILHVNKV